MEPTEITPGPIIPEIKPKNKITKKIIIGLILVVMVCAVGIFLFNKFFSTTPSNQTITPKEADELISDVSKSYSSSDTEGAISSLIKLSERDPTNVSIYNTIAFMYEGKNDLANAEVYYKKSIQVNSSFVDGYINLAKLLDRAGKREEAILILNQGLKINIDNEKLKALLDEYGK